MFFTAEFCFGGEPDNRRITIWRECDTRNIPAFVHESVRFGGCGVMVWDGISINSRTNLYIIRNGALTAQRYRDEILGHIVSPYVAEIGDEFVLMDDNTRPHCARLIDNFLCNEGILRMDWKAYLPAMNSTEHIRDILARTVAGRLSYPKTIQQLESLLIHDWELIPQSLFDNVIYYMPRRCVTLLLVKGSFTLICI